MSDLRSELETAHALIQLWRRFAGECFNNHSQWLAVFEQPAAQVRRFAERAADLEIHTVEQSRDKIATFGTKLDVELFQHDGNGPNDRIRHRRIVKPDRYRPQSALDVLG